MKTQITLKTRLEAAWNADEKLFSPDAEQPPACLRCGKPLHSRLVINALSRYAQVHICSDCGMDEALRDVYGFPLPLSEWSAVKHGLLGRKREKR